VVARTSPAPGNRIAVIGTSGCGKTTVAMALAAALGLRYVCNDAIIWRPDWQVTPDDEVYAEMDAATRDGGWTFDGNLGPRPCDQLVQSRCDTIVWLDLPRWQVWSQVSLRTLRRLVTRERLWHGNVESLRTLFSSDSIVWWSIKTFDRRRRRYGELFADPAHADRARIRLRSRGEVDAWLRSLNAAGPGSRAL
jgi:adenylate kinase family enzyme